ncbi:FHA domain-containing protein DDL [Zancudomyces culisetae]|uniref:FHA domain-containing protein DDL n=1 Tax=Zancudomyces culisetae TaxID=1213189 RepID=A0A1R1PXX6_ZANCU|nr:FHA domain-containing protein DDL [Zancudomyces culisetae]|eukprot:OMH85772.1 FHA domain-containing protein DDL [Zancudomyces culisetae]
MNSKRKIHRVYYKDEDKAQPAKKIGKTMDDDRNEGKKTEHEKVEPNFELSGSLAKDTNKIEGVVVKYNEPAEARRPKDKWRLYVFKGDEEIGRYSWFCLFYGLLGKLWDFSGINTNTVRSDKYERIYLI